MLYKFLRLGMNGDKLFVEVLEIFFGIFAATTIGAPIKDSTGCRGSWQYLQIQNGWGCVRPLTSKFTDRACLTRGFHLALDQRHGKKADLLCIKNEADRDCGLDNGVPPNINDDHMTTTATPTSAQIDHSDKKDGIEQGDTKKDLARSLGCCMPGLSPISPGS